ncbi:MAG: TonB-dependent receptor [Woeseiaceae bacterium]|nr:TonB-dependent receptor [Woeseiaceae bacterium]
MKLKKHQPAGLAAVLLTSLLAADLAIAQDSVLDEVTVTAQRREQNLNDVGISISAITGDQMAEMGIVDATEMANITPGFVITETQPSGIPIYTIRGVGFDDYSIGSNSTVGVYLDDVALPYPVMTQGVMFDVERIEVLKGPQGDLYGRNNTGGAINIISKKPTQEFEAGVTLDAGNFEYFRTDAFVSGGLGDQLSARLAVTSTQQGEGWQESVSRPGDKLGEIDEVGARLLLRWTPSNTVDVTLNVNGNRDRSDGQAAFVQELTSAAVPVNFQPGVATTNNPTLYPVLAFLAELPLDPNFAGFADVLQYAPTSKDASLADWGTRPVRDNTNSGVGLTINWDINEAYGLTSITGYRRFERSEDQDWDGTPLAMWDSFMESDIDGVSQELRLSYNGGGSVTWVGGIYLSSDTVDDEFIGDVSNTGAGGGGLGFNAFRTAYEQETDALGVFGHAEFEFGDGFRLTLGARYTDETREWVGCTHDHGGDIAWLYNNVFLLSQPGFVPFEPNECLSIDGSAVNPATGEIDNPLFREEIQTDNFSGKAGLDWFARDDVLVYVSISSGFKSGGYNGSPVNDWSAMTAYKEETLLAYELGTKATLADGAMQLNGAAFFYDYDDKQAYDSVDTLFGPLVRLTNVPKSEVQGLELEWNWLPTDALEIRLAAMFLDSEVIEYTDFYGEDLAGRELAQTPDLQYSGVVAYTVDLANKMTLRFATDFNYSDKYSTILGDAGDLVVYEDMIAEDWFVVNGRITLMSDDARWALALWGKNIGDEFYQPSKNWGNDMTFGMAGKVRTYGVSFEYNWF